MDVAARAKFAGKFGAGVPSALLDESSSARGEYSMVVSLTAAASKQIGGVAKGQSFPPGWPVMKDHL